VRNSRAQPSLVGLDIGRAAPAQPPLLDRGERNRERADDLLDHLVLCRKDVGEIAIESLGPEMAAGCCIDELRRDAHAVGGLAHTALEHEAHAEIAPYVLHLRRPALVDEG
jgi:hypothetical protein